MNKSDLINEVANNTGLTKAKASEALEAVIKAIESTLANGQEVSLLGFGSFKTTQKAERTGRNPKTGEEIKIAAKKAVKFKPGSKLSNLVNG